jgi:hypothetical protein
MRQMRFYAGAGAQAPPVAAQAPQIPLMLFPDGTGLLGIG